MKLVFKRLLFLTGLVLASAAFLAAGAEIAALVLNPDLSMLPGAAQVWQTLAPTSFEAALAAAQEHPTLSALMSALSLPGWLVLGVPGLACIVLGRERDGSAESDGEHSLFLFDELATRAREEGYDGSDNDAPTSAFDFQPADEDYALPDAPKDDEKARDFLLGDKDH